MNDHIVGFEDGSQLTISATEGEASRAFNLYVPKIADAIHRAQIALDGICCIELKANLGADIRYPRVAYISPSAWNRNHRRAGWYQGATRPGYYVVWKIKGKMKMAPAGEMPDSVFLLLEYCPFCHTRLNEIKEG